MAKFCTKCGRRLIDGQPCSCTQTQQPVHDMQESVQKEVKDKAKNFFTQALEMIKQNTNFGMEVDGLKEMKLQPLHYSMIYLENFPSLIIQNLKNGYCSISIVHAMISHSEQQIIL